MDATLIPDKRVGKMAEDRISSLPDSLLTHILSFLPDTKSAVRTSILSNRWRYVFASLPNLDFDDLVSHKLSTNFSNFVDRLISMRNVDLDRFRLKCASQNIDVLRVYAWICAVLLHNIQELDLCILIKGLAWPETKKQLLPPPPSNLFTSPTLVVLKLDAYLVLNVPIEVCLQNLKIIHLTDIVFPDEDTISRLISNCPMLEDLVFKDCCLSKIKIFNICSPTLKRLTIDTENSDYCAYELVINAPNLVYFDYLDYVPQSFSATNLQSLGEAQINIALRIFLFRDYKCDYRRSIAQILRGTATVRSLSISDEVLGTFLERPYHRLPTFHCLTHLVIGVIHGVDRKLLLLVLQSSPILESIVFTNGAIISYGEFEGDPNPPEPLPSCLLFHLKTIEIKVFEGYKAELDAVKYLLKNANVLERMKIHFSNMTLERKYRVTKKLSNLPKGSTTCEVFLV